jgi:broad specificity phosphatase PhoE
MFNSDVIREIFVMKAKRWDKIAIAYLDEVWMMVRNALTVMAQHFADAINSQRIIRHVITSKLERKRDTMNLKLQELLLPYRQCHPITYDPIFEIKIPQWGRDKHEHVLMHRTKHFDMWRHPTSAY